MNFVALKVRCHQDFRDILIAELGVLGFDSMIETAQGFDAYINESEYHDKLLDDLKSQYAQPAQFDYQVNQVARENWNKEWEKNYDPIVVADKCIVRASFHDIREKYDYDIVINPKMSFGTGHHETTYLMLQHQMELDLTGKKVMDAGCGTGILAIMAGLRGAKDIDAFDIDEWCVENSKENFSLNKLEMIKLHLGNISEMSFNGQYDIIIANINKNVLLEEIATYNKYLINGGLLLLSGFYEQDIDDLQKAGEKHGLSMTKQSVRNNWAAIILKKP